MGANSVMPTTSVPVLLDIADVTVLSGGEGALLLWDQQLLGDAVLLGQLLHGSALIGIAQHTVDVLRQIGALAAADAVLLLGEPVGIGEIQGSWCPHRSWPRPSADR